MEDERKQGLTAALAATYDAVTEVVQGLEDDQFALSTRTSAWTVQQLLSTSFWTPSGRWQPSPVRLTPSRTWTR